MSINAVSLFSGCGGFDIGAQRNGINILWANDVNKNVQLTYQRNFPQTEFRLGDIRQIAKSSIPEADLLIGCYPCQGFSNAAWRKWKNRDRDLRANQDNYLFLEFTKSIPYVNPKFVFIENVPGLKSAENGYFFKAQEEALIGSGYTVYSSKLKAHEFGVPQTRQRIFFVGVRNDLQYEYKFPAAQHGPGKLPYQTMHDTILHLPEWPTGDYLETQFHGHYLTRNRKKAWDECSYTIVADCDHVTLHPMGAPMKKIGKDQWVLQGTTNRRLSWRECSILQSFDETFEPAGNLTAKYLQIGNAVPPRVAELLVKPVVDWIKQQNGSIDPT